MKKLSILFIIFTLAFISCGEETISQKEKRETRLRAKQEKELIDVPVTAKKELIDVPVTVELLTESVEKVVHVTYTTEPTDSSYWYVIMKDDVTTWHGTVNLPTPYFDFLNAKEQFNGAKGKCYFKFILQIAKESEPSFYKLYE